MVATDGTPEAEAAVQRSMELLRSDAEIIVVTVVPAREDPMDDAGGFEGPLQTPEEADADYAEGLEQGRSAVAAADEVVGGADGVRILAAEDDAGHALVRLAGELAPDVLVIGASGKGAIRRFLQGSVSDHVIHHAPCPVLVVRHDDHDDE